MLSATLLEHMQSDVSPAGKIGVIFSTWRHKQFVASWLKHWFFFRLATRLLLVVFPIEVERAVAHPPEQDSQTQSKDMVFVLMF